MALITSSSGASNVTSSEVNLKALVGPIMVATLGGLLFGYDTAVISGALGYLNTFFGLDPASEGFAAASILIGCTAGAAIASRLSTALGRKRSLITASLLFLIASVLTAIPQQYWQLIVARFIGGVGVGIASMVSPMYIAEISPAKIRGKLVSFNQFAIVFGILLSFFVNYMLNRPNDLQWCVNTGWRLMFLMMAIPSALFFVFCFFIPESPRWLVINNKETAAYATLERINGTNAAKAILEEIKTALVEEARQLGGNIFARGIFMAVIVGILLSVFQQVTGINTILYFAPEIFKKLGSDNDTSFLQSVIVGVVNVLFTIIAILTVDKSGRKPLLVIGALGMAVGMIGLGMFAYNQNLGMGALVFIMIYIAAFAMSWGPVTWVMISEIFPNSVRSKAMGVAVAAQWISNFFVSQTFPMMLRNPTLEKSFHGGFPFFIYGLMGIVAVFFVWRMVPETKGKTLEEMEQLWIKK